MIHIMGNRKNFCLYDEILLKAPGKESEFDSWDCYFLSSVVAGDRLLVINLD